MYALYKVLLTNLIEINDIPSLKLIIKTGDNSELISEGNNIYRFKTPFPNKCISVLLTDIIGIPSSSAGDMAALGWNSSLPNYTREKFQTSQDIGSFTFLAIGY